MRAFVEQSVTQARQAFDGFVQAANQGHGPVPRARPRPHASGANEIAQKSMSYAEQNMAATFEFAQKLMQAKDGDRGHAAAVGIPRPANAGAFNPGPGAWTKCRQNGGGCCETSAVIPAQRHRCR